LIILFDALKLCKPQSGRRFLEITNGAGLAEQTRMALIEYTNVKADRGIGPRPAAA
jgi:hypothetical protein